MQTNKKSYYSKVFKQHWKPISILIVLMFTIPLYIFIALPPIEITNKIPQQHIVQVPNQIIRQVNTTRNVTVNITQGSSVFLSKEAPPPLIDSDIVVVVDTSGSMAGTRLSIAKTAINSLISTLNQSSQSLHTKDRIGLVTFGGTNDGNWANDAYYQTGLGFVSNQTFLNLFQSKTNAITTGITGSNTDIWAGLNFSLQLLINNPRNSSSLKSVILLTDGVDNMGPFSTQVQNGNFTGFLGSYSNYSSNYKTPLSESPVAVARSKGIKIDTIGIYDGNTYGFDPNFLLNISQNPSLGTFGNYFIGNDSLSISESFLQARDSASGWVQLLSNNFNISNSGSSQLFTFNVTEKQRRLKWDINWENTSISMNAILTYPNGSVIEINKSSLPENFNLISQKNPFSLIMDFPEQGLWKFNITWSNIIGNQTIIDRLSSYQPPIFIDKVISLNTSTNETQQSHSLIFKMEVSNKNPIFSFHNITPVLIANFTEFNSSYSWTPKVVSEIAFNASTTFLLNLTFQDNVQIDGTFLMMVNCSEGYYDAYAQPLLADLRTSTTKTSIETIVENQTVVSTSISTSIGYNYNRQIITQLNWAGFAITFLLLLAITSLYIRSKEDGLRKIALQFKTSFFHNKTVITAGLTNIGVDLSNVSVDQLLSQISHLDELGTAIGVQTGTKLSAEDLIKVASGVTTSKIANRLSNKTGESLGNILDLIAGASSIEEISQKLNMSYDEFMFIITPDEQVEGFQKLLKSIVRPLGVPASSRMFINDNIILEEFRDKLKRSIETKH